MAKRPCLDCSTLTDRSDHRCPTCASAWHRARDARRGSRHERGLGSEHDRIRERLLLTFVPGTLCPRCEQPMWREQELDAGHPLDAPRRLDRQSKADHLEHARCNRGERVTQSEDDG